MKKNDTVFEVRKTPRIGRDYEKVKYNQLETEQDKEQKHSIVFYKFSTAG